MSIQQDRLAAEGLVVKYADAVNAADRKTIASLYSEDGLFMPEGMGSLTRDDLSKKGKKKSSNIHFHLSYDINDIVISNQYAFVIAHATTNIVNLKKDTQITRSSRDFLVLRKEGEEWKVFRYIFNYALVK